MHRLSVAQGKEMNIFVVVFFFFVIFLEGEGVVSRVTNKAF